MDVKLIFSKCFKRNNINDSTLARTLDKIYATGAKKVFCHFALKALFKEDLLNEILQSDTTVRLVSGDYTAEKGLNITYGYNKEAESIMLAGKKKNFEPTVSKFLDLFDSIKIICLIDGRSLEHQLPNHMGD